MGKIYDDWERLVEAVVRNERFRELAMCDSTEPSTISEESSRLSVTSNSVLDEELPLFDLDSEIASTCSINSSSLFSEQSLVSDDEIVSPNEALPAPASYDALPDFTEVSNLEKSELFIKKVRMCYVLFDFGDLMKHLREKEIKRKTLLELVDYVTCADTEFSECAIEAFVGMVSVNAFRDITPQPRENAVSLEEDEPIDPAWLHWMPILDRNVEEGELVGFELAWPHLQIVYELLLRFVVSPQIKEKVAKKYIDRTFILKLLNRFDSEDFREREYLKIILHRIYRKFFVHRPFIRKSINDIFHHFVFETEKHNGIAEFLEVLGSIISGINLPLKQEHTIFLLRTLIPLHKPKCLAMYHKQLSYCIVEFVRKDCKLAYFVFKGLIRYWPVTNSLKEVLFLGALEQVLEVTHETEFKQCVVPLFNQISLCLSSSHSWVAEGALFFWNNEYTVNLIKQNCEAILPIIFSDLERNARDHWNPGVRDLTMKVRDFFYDLSPYLFKECQVKFQDDKLKEEDIKERREVMWKKLEELAARKESIIFPQKGHHSTSPQKVMHETCQGACRFFTREDPPISPRGTNILPKLLEQISNLESQRADLEFGIDKLLTAKTYLERELERSKRGIRDLQRANNELHARNKVIEKELERTHDLRGRDRSRLQCFYNKIMEVKNKLTEVQMERRKSEIRDLQVIDNELKSSNQVTEKELTTIKITLRVVFFAVLFYLLSSAYH